MPWPATIANWGSRDAERDESFPCDALVAPADLVLFGRMACTYRADAAARGRSRILVKLLCAYPPRALHAPLMRLILPPGDLFMMRRQLLNLKRLAESEAAG